MEMASMETRLMRMETAVETLTRTVDGLADAIVARVVRALDDSARAPLVLTKQQLQAAVRAAMDSEATNTSSKRKRSVGAEESAEEGGDADVVVVVTPPVVAKSKPVKTTETKAPRRIEAELELPSPASLSLAMFDIAIEPQRSVPPSARVEPASKKPLPPKQPAPVAVRQPQAVLPPPPLVATRPPLKPTPTRPSVVTPPPPQQQQWAPLPVQVQTTPAVSGRLYLWGNAWHNLPEEFEFPKQSLELMWRQWCCGDGVRGYLPLREIQTSDVASANQRKRLSDLKFLMKFIEQRLQAIGVWKETPSEIEADQMLRAVRGDLFPDAVGKNSVKRDAEGLKWHSAVTLLRSAAKKARTE